VGEEIPPQGFATHAKKPDSPVKPGNDERKRPACLLLRSQVKISIFHPPLTPPIEGGESWNHSLSGGEGDYPLHAAPSGRNGTRRVETVAPFLAQREIPRTIPFHAFFDSLSMGGEF